MYVLYTGYWKGPVTGKWKGMSTGNGRDELSELSAGRGWGEIIHNYSTEERKAFIKDQEREGTYI